jgi:hypothetical protein
MGRIIGLQVLATMILSERLRWPNFWLRVLGNAMRKANSQAYSVH